MKDIINGILYGISYFTFLPVKVGCFQANKNFYKGVLISLGLSGILLASIIVLLFIFIPAPDIYLAILVSILYLFLYGFLHLEAVGDTIDGLFASLGKKDIYHIMKQPQIGAIGAIGTFCFVLLKILAISMLLIYGHYAIVFLALILSRISVLFALDLEFHKSSSFINSLKESFDLPRVFRLILFPFDFLTKYILNKLKKQLGFLNGDTLGFNIELQEIIFLHIGVIVFC
jgi:adenosylcobinamide-GDP ribazoletransferase